VLDKSVPHPRILLIGADGQVGWELRRTLAPLGRFIAAFLDGTWGPRVDLADPGSTRNLVREAAPDVVVNAAEGEREPARRINAEAPGMLGGLLRERGIP